MDDSICGTMTKERAEKELAEQMKLHPEGQVCEFCNTLLPWDRVFAHALRHPEAFEERPGLTRSQAKKMGKFRKKALANLEAHGHL